MTEERRTGSILVVDDDPINRMLRLSHSVC